MLVGSLLARTSKKLKIIMVQVTSDRQIIY
jgi:hypothetical protein